jgi:hypothetical protein
MKDTMIPLSVAFVTDEGRVATMRDMQPCAADPCATYSSTAAYLLAVEANEGWFTDHGVHIGDSAQLSEVGDG